MSLSNTILNDIESINESTFDATVSVCMALYENYTKAIEMNMYAEQSGIDIPDCLKLFEDHFITEDGESIWRKNKKDGTREHIIISILLLPLRLIQALIRLIRGKRDKKKAHDFESVMGELDEKVHQYYQYVGGQPTPTQQQPNWKPQTFSSEKKIKVTTPTGSTKTETVKVEVDPGNTNDKIIVTNVNPTEIENKQIKLNTWIVKYRDKFGDFTDYESARKIAKDAVKRGKMDPMEAVDFVQYVTGRRELTITEVIDGVKASYDAMDETERMCKDYEATLQHLIKTIRDNPSGDLTKDDDIIRKLTELQGESSKIIVASSDMVKYIDAVVSACMDAADKFLKSRA